MIYLGKHRIITELEKEIRKGQNLFFLTGDGIGDHFFYNVYFGCRSMEDTLRLHFLEQEQSFDCMVHVVSGTNDPICWQRENGTVRKVEFKDLLEPTKRNSVLNKGGSKNRQQKPSERNFDDSMQEAVNDVRDGLSPETVIIESMTKLLRAGQKRVLLYLDGLEWIADFYGAQVDNTWIAALRRWERMRTLLAVVKINDLEHLEKYRFDYPSIFVGYPTADEIKYAFLRYLLRNAREDYDLNMGELEEIAQMLSVGKKPLVACLRILRKVLAEHPHSLQYQDFEGTFEENIQAKFGERIVCEAQRAQ